MYPPIVSADIWTDMCFPAFPHFLKEMFPHKKNTKLIKGSPLVSWIKFYIRILKECQKIIKHYIKKNFNIIETFYSIYEEKQRNYIVIIRLVVQI